MTGPTVTGPLVRTALAADAGAIAGLLGELGYPATVHQVAARLAVMPEDFATWVAETREDDPSVVGVAAARTSWRLTDDAPVAQLVTLVTDPDRRGTGAGSALVRSCEDWARARGAHRLLVTSGLRRPEAHRWYLRRGFEHTGIRLAETLTDR